MSRRFPEDSAKFIDLGDITGARFPQASTWTLLFFFRTADTASEENCAVGKFGAGSQLQQFAMRVLKGTAPRKWEIRRGGAAIYLSSGAVVNEDKWYLVAVVNDGTGDAGGLRILQYQMDVTEDLDDTDQLTADVSDLSASILLGKRNGANDPMDGDLAWVCYVDRDASKEEVKEYLHSPWSAALSWKARGDTVHFLHDLAGNSPEVDLGGEGNDGTVNGAPAYSDMPPVWPFPFGPDVDGAVKVAAGPASVAKAKGESKGSAEPTAVRISPADAKAEAVASAKPTAVRISPASSIGVAIATARGARVALSGAEAKAESESSAFGNLVRTSRAIGQGESRASAIGTVIRAGRASAIGETKAKSFGTIPVAGNAGKGKGETRSSAKATVIRAGRAAAQGEARTSSSQRALRTRASSKGISRASAKGTIVRMGRASAVGDGVAHAIFIQVSWKYWLIRGGTEHEKRSTYLPVNLDTEALVHPRNRPADRDHRKASVLASRKFPPLRAYLRIRLQGEVNYTARDLSGADVRIKIIDIHGNVKVDQPVVIEESATGLVRYDWQLGDLDTLVPFLVRWRVTWSKAMPLFFPLRREVPLAVV